MKTSSQYVTKTCPWCSVNFSVLKKRKNQKHCSRSCGGKATHAYHKSIGFVRKNFKLTLDSKLAPTERPQMKDIYWAAGIFEGEGSCSQTKKNGNQISVGQKDRWLCDRMRAFFGGSVYEGRCNCQPFYVWQVSGARARGFLMTIYALMSPRRQQQIRAALQLQEPAAAQAA